MALTTLAAVKAQAGISASDTSRDFQLKSFIDGVSSLMKRQLMRDIENQEYVEFHSGNGLPFLLLRQFPVTAVTTVCVDDAGYFGTAPSCFDSSQNLVEGVDYALVSGFADLGSSGILRRIGSTWHQPASRTRGVLQTLPGVPCGNIKVQYTAGFQVIPPGISLAVNSLVIKLCSQAELGGAIQSMSYEDAAVTYLNPADLVHAIGSIESTLANYRSIPI